jgi:O-antigen ligase
LLTYFSVSTAEGPFGWGTGRLRVMGETGAAVYAGRNPNKLAYFALFGLTLLWYARRAIKNPLLYPFWGVATAITFIMIPLTGSRSGLLNLLFFLAIVMLEGRFSYRKVVGLTLVTFFIAVQFGYDVSVVELFFPEDVAQRLTRVGVRADILEDQGLAAAGSAEGRFRTIQAAFRVWQFHPLFGAGIGNFNTERAATDPFGTVGPPHNSYLWSLAEGGLVAFVLYLTFFWWIFRRLRGIEWEYQARFGPVDLGWMTSALRTVIIGFMLFSFFADMWHHELFYIIVGMCVSEPDPPARRVRGDRPGAAAFPHRAPATAGAARPGGHGRVAPSDVRASRS